MTARFSLQVARFAVQVPGQISLDDQGMLAATNFFGAPAADLVEVAALASGGSLCVLGEPGAGKTTALQILVRDLPDPADATPGQPAALTISLGEVTDRAAFRELVTRPVLTRAPRASASQRAAGAQTTLVLDGLDECPLPNAVKTLASLLREMLKDVDTSALRVLVGCRTAEYPELLDSILRQSLPSFEVYELAPLSRQNVHDLAASRGAEPEAFLSAVAGTGTGPLASLPLTLDLLLRQYAATGGLHGGATEIYETSLRALADEPDPDRARERRAPGSGEQHLAVAARLCCYLLLCGRAAFWTGAAGLAPPGDLEPSRLAGGEELQTGGTFAVTDELVDAALRSALFTSRGRGRLGPAHATFGAYLAARHLAAHNLPKQQLQSLLTIRTDSGSTGIAANLRETAAWLVALRPELTGWLTDLEPASFAAYAAVIDSAEIRELIVERLLADPHAALAGGWHPGWRLAHPGLPNQLSSVLTPLADSTAPRPPREKSYLALSLARQTEQRTLTPTLLAIARSPDADPELRSLAIDSAAHLDRVGSAPVLADVLREITLHPDHDPNDEIRGALLEATWPGQLSITDLTSALTRPHRDDYIGRYFGFRYRLPRLLSDDDVPHVLRWALAGSAVTDYELRDTEPVTTLPFHDAELVKALLNRAFECQDPSSNLEPAATLIAAQLRAYRDLEVPEALDHRDAEGIETNGSRDMRRSLAGALLAAHADDDHAGQLTTWGWQPSRTAVTRHAEALERGMADYPHARRGLLDSTDLSWVLEHAKADTLDRAGIYVPLLRALYDPSNPAAQEVAWQVRDTPFWPAFSPWFDPIALGSEAEAEARHILELSRPRRAAWDQAPRHAAHVLDLYSRAATETSAFWQLLHDLQIDPETGRGLHNYLDDIATRPGVRLLPGGWLNHLHEAAWYYLHESTPDDNEFLDKPDVIYWPAEAGYLALALLIRHEVPGRTLDALDSRILARWAASILVFPAVPANAGDIRLKRVLLRRLAHAAPGGLPDLVERILLGHLALERRPSELVLLDSACTDAIAEMLTRRLPDVITALQGTLAKPPATSDPDPAAPSGTQEAERERRLWDQRLAALRDTIALIVGLLVRCRHTPGIQLALNIVTDAAGLHTGEAAAQAGRVAATALLADDATYWADVFRRVKDVPDLARAVFQDLARDREGSALLHSLTEEQLTELWDLLVRYWPYHHDVGLRIGAHFVGPDEQAQHWRDAVLNELVRRGTSQAVNLLSQLAAMRPALPWLADQIRVAQEVERERSWAPPSPEQLTQLLTDQRSRLVRDGADLADLITDALAVAAQRLTRTGQLLWNNYRNEGQERWRPKSEPDVGAWLSEQLNIELAESGIVINREVLVRQTSTRGQGLAVDVQADAPLTSEEHAGPARCRIELKGNWHPDLMTAMRTQLADDYLLPEGLREGIYVTAWFDIALWNDASDSRRERAATRDYAGTVQELAAQAEMLNELDLRVRSVIINIPRPAPSSRSRSPDPLVPAR